MKLSDKERKRLADLIAKLAGGGAEAEIAARMIGAMSARLNISGGELQEWFLSGIGAHPSTETHQDDCPAPRPAPAETQRQAKASTAKAEIRCPECNRIGGVSVNKGKFKLTCFGCSGKWIYDIKLARWRHE